MKRKMEPKSKHRYKKRAGFNTEHHIRNRKNGGESIKSNLLTIDAYKHSAWHLLFKDMTIEQVIAFLTRVNRAKKSQQFHLIMN